MSRVVHDSITSDSEIFDGDEVTDTVQLVLRLRALKVESVRADEGRMSAVTLAHVK